MMDEETCECGHVADEHEPELTRLREIKRQARALVQALREEEWIQGDGGSTATRTGLDLLEKLISR